MKIPEGANHETFKEGYKQGQEDLYSHYFKGMEHPVIMERKNIKELTPKKEMENKDGKV